MNELTDRKWAPALAALAAILACGSHSAAAQRVCAS
jgi:hypothetical protein